MRNVAKSELGGNLVIIRRFTLFHCMGLNLSNCKRSWTM